MRDKDTEKMMIGKTITDVQINGFGITITLDDGYTLDYDASDGGYSTWELCKGKV